MKQIILAILIVTAFFYGCKEGKDEIKTNNKIDTATVKKNIVAELDTAALFAKLIALEDSLRKDRANRKIIAELLKTSFDSSSGSFFTVGKGVANPKLPEPAQNAGRKRAAEIDAKRWILYIKSWYNNSQASLGDSISGQVTYSSNVAELIKGDTLLQLVQVPLGSVIVQD